MTDEGTATTTNIPSSSSDSNEYIAPIISTAASTVSDIELPVLASSSRHEESSALPQQTSAEPQQNNLVDTREELPQIIEDDNNDVVNHDNNEKSPAPSTPTIVPMQQKLSSSTKKKTARRRRRRPKFIFSTPSKSENPNNNNNSNNANMNEEKLDTYNGVFLPCLAQIVGVIFFLRLPTITGQAGTVHTTLIILTCVLSTFVTSLSLSAIASNGTIQAGGPYYIISRTLGVEIGGALGILFYLGTTLGASMHVMGAVETVFSRNGKPYQLDNFGIFLSIVDTVPSQVWSLLLMFTIATIVSVGSKYVTRAANFFLGVVGLSILSIMMGALLFAAGWYDGSLNEEDRVFNDNLHPNYRPDSNTGYTPTFWDLVALFYPATTGILAGTNRSSKLATPNRSIPKGTIGAIGVTTLLYLFQTWLLGSVVSNEILIHNKLVVAAIAFPSPVVAKLGVVTACIGAALQCMAGGPQLLGAIAADDAIPFLKFLTRKKRRRNDLIKATNTRGVEVVELEGIGLSTSLDKTLPLNVDFESEASEKVEAENSKRAVWFSWGIASLGTLLGNIDHITPILTMFYLIMYGGINFCCFLLAWVDSPGFRPQFKYFSEKLALLGFLWCIGLAFVISWQMATLALGLVYVIFKYIRLSSDNRLEGGGSSPGADWGEALDSVKYKLTTAVLARVTGTENFHAKNWIPQVLTVVDTDEGGHPLQSELLSLAAQLQKGRGLNVVISIKDGSFLGNGVFEKSQHCKTTLKKFMEKERLTGYAKVIFSNENYPETVWNAVMNSGLGPVSPNMVLMSWVTDWKKKLLKQQNEGESTLATLTENTEKTRSVYDYVDTLKGLINMKRVVCILKGLTFPQARDKMPRGSTIDIYWVVDDGGICLLMSYILSMSTVWRSGVKIRVFVVLTDADENPLVVENAVVDFLQQMRIDASVLIVDLQNASLQDDFRTEPFSTDCPPGMPTLTVGEKFDLTKAGNDDESTAMSSRVSYYGGPPPAPESTKANPIWQAACLPCDYDNYKPTPGEAFPPVSTMPLGASQEKDTVMRQHPPPQQTRCLSLDTAKKFNNLIRRHSLPASLVVTHLPLLHKAPALDFMEYVDAMMNHMNNVLLILGTGVEYLTTVA